VSNAVREDGKQGVLIQVQNTEDEPHKEEESYLVKLSEDKNHLDVINSAVVQKKWSLNASKASVGAE
jgi:hypothetical protein